MSPDDPTAPPPFSSDLASLVWPMSVEEFVSGAMHTEVFLRRGSVERLSRLREPLSSYDLRQLFAHGDETTIWKEGGLRTTRGTDGERDLEALVSGTTVQTHLQGKLAFGGRFIATLAQQMHLERGFFSIFASRDTHTATHYDRNYNFTIQLSGEKTWTVHTEGPAVESPSDNMGFDFDRLSAALPHMHGAVARAPGESPSSYHLRPGDLLYCPPGYWHATECVGLSISLNLSLAPRAWFQVLGGALMRHLEAQPAWRAPFGEPTRGDAVEHLARLKRLVDSVSADDLVPRAGGPPTVHADEPLRRTLGSLLMWEREGAGLHYGADELRFLATGTRGRLLDTIDAHWEGALMLLADLERPTTARALSVEAQMDCEPMHAFVQRLVDVGYLGSAAPSSEAPSNGRSGEGR